MSARQQPIEHYENFPVASWLCPARLRPPIAAIYHFARTADDIADEGNASAADRLTALTAYGLDLDAAARGEPDSGQWPMVFLALRPVLQEFTLPLPLLHDLLSAFTQDVVKTRDAEGYANVDALRDYCNRSANPVGRLLLHLYGVNDSESLIMSDHICTALQLINFWQDLSVDIPRGRLYLPAAELTRHGVLQADILAMRQSPATAQLIAAQAADAARSMHLGAALVKRVPGRGGWELRFVVQGGLRILDKMAANGHDTLIRRPVIGRWDLVVIAWRTLWM